MAMAITSLIIFFIFAEHAEYATMATCFGDLSHSLLLLVGCLVTSIAYAKIRKLKFQSGKVLLTSTTVLTNISEPIFLHRVA